MIKTITPYGANINAAQLAKTQGSSEGTKSKAGVLVGVGVGDGVSVGVGDGVGVGVDLHARTPMVRPQSASVRTIPLMIADDFLISSLDFLMELLSS
jgi:hypothetical protein